MSTFKLYYEHKTANGTWLSKEYITKDPKDYKRAVDVCHSNPDEYKIVNVEKDNKELD